MELTRWMKYKKMYENWGPALMNSLNYKKPFMINLQNVILTANY